MKRQKLAVEKRTALGKKVKKLRKEGVLPGNIYGKDVKSEAVQIPLKEFEKVYKEAGETGLVDLEIDGQLRPVLIHNVQMNYRTSIPLHADFFQVNLKEKVKTMVPIIVVGEPKAVLDKVGLLLQPLAEIEVEALPEDLPEGIEVNVERLAAIDEQATVADLKVPKGVEILTDPSQVVVKITELVSKEAQEQAAAEAAAAAEAKAETSAEAGQVPAGGTEEASEAQTTTSESASAKATADKETPKE